jgi:hypothetical protein
MLQGRSTFSVHSTVAGRLRLKCLKDYLTEVVPEGADTLPTSSTLAKTGRNHLNEEITPLLPIGIGERRCQTISNLEHAALLRRCELPPLNEKCWTKLGGPSSSLITLSYSMVSYRYRDNLTFQSAAVFSARISSNSERTYLRLKGENQFLPEEIWESI